MLIFVDKQSSIDEVYSYVLNFIQPTRILKSSDLINVDLKGNETITIKILNQSARGYKDNTILYYGEFTEEQFWFMRCCSFPKYDENFNLIREPICIPLFDFDFKNYSLQQQNIKL